MSKQITIRIYPDGKIETKKYLQPLEQMLEAQTVDSEFTQEYYENEVNEIQQEQRTIEIQ